MTWGAILRHLLTDPLALALAFIVGILCAFGGYFYGLEVERKSNEAEQAKAAIVELQKVKAEETKTSNAINEKAAEYDKAKKDNESKSNSVANQFAGVPFKPCKSVPTVASVTAESSRSAGSERLEAERIYFDDIAEQVASLGRDYDNAAGQIKSLTETIAAYRKLTKSD